MADDDQTLPSGNEAEGGIEGEDRTKSLRKLVKFQRKDLLQQKNTDREAFFTSGKFGRIEIVDEQEGSIIVKGAAPQPEPSPPAEDTDSNSTV